MAISVEFSEPKTVVPSKGSAGLRTQLGGCCTTVSTLRQASEASGNAGLVR